jgi:hypothetical protein
MAPSGDASALTPRNIDPMANSRAALTLPPSWQRAVVRPAITEASFANGASVNVNAKPWDYGDVLLTLHICTRTGNGKRDVRPALSEDAEEDSGDDSWQK